MIVMTDGGNRPVSLGSGFIVAPNIVVTNYHVVSDAKRGTLKFVGDKDIYSISRIVATDPKSDIALLEVNGLNAPPLSLGADEPPQVGDDIYVIGSPKGFEGTFSRGNVSGIREIDDVQHLQITAPISEGSSGGPVLNSSGQVVGVAVATYKGGQNLNFAIPAKYVRRVLDSR